MTKISSKPLRIDDEERFLDDFWSAIASLEDKKETRGFLTEILTPTERLMIAKRIQIAMMLILKYDYQEIKNRVKVTNETIAKVNNLLKEKGKTLEKVAKRLIRLKMKKMKSWQQQSRGFKTTGSILVESAVRHIGREVLAGVGKYKKKLSITK